MSYFIIIKSVTKVSKYKNSDGHILTIFKNHTYFCTNNLGRYG